VVSSLGFAVVGADAVNTVTEIVWRDARQLEEQLVQSAEPDGLRHEIVVRQGNV